MHIHYFTVSVGRMSGHGSTGTSAQDHIGYNSGVDQTLFLIWRLNLERIHFQDHSYCWQNSFLCGSGIGDSLFLQIQQQRVRDSRDYLLVRQNLRNITGVTYLHFWHIIMEMASHYHLIGEEQVTGPTHSQVEGITEGCEYQELVPYLL